MDIARSASGFTPIPPRLGRLLELAYNLWWSWNPAAQELFRAIDDSLWEEVYHNPVRFLREIRQATLEQAASAPKLLRQFHRVMADFDSYMAGAHTWFGRTHPSQMDIGPIAYFSAEFGLHECLPIYSGGLGILSGDHCKEASDLGLPFVGVGFLYPQGYFRQQIAASGDQEAIYEKLNFAEVPALPAFNRDGQEIVVEIQLPGRTVYAKVWKIQVGRIPLYLMDTDIHPNAQPDRHLSARLYGGDREMRLSQEMVLGIGGVRTLAALGIQPSAWHANEGHPAFMLLERVRDLVQSGASFEEASEIVKRTSVFTTHTPVPAGHDVFSFDLMNRFFKGYWEEMGISQDEFLNIARQDQQWGPSFSMTVLGLRLSDHHNGVSKLHGKVSRNMWQFLWPERTAEEVPISSITNGIHTGSWLAPEMRQLFNSYLPQDWMDAITNLATWDNITTIPDSEMWQVRQQLRQKLVEFVRHRAQVRLRRLGAEAWQLDNANSFFDPNALTIGFARRFATYKRATLLFSDIDRLKHILNQTDQPVQIIFAGKAHPADDPGRNLIRQVYNRSNEPGLAGRIIFLENYDINVARYLVQGADVWLNNPRRPLEASGTSGQKAALNGVPNLSVSDGWWAEGYNGNNGWVIGDNKEWQDQGAKDWEDSQSLYQLLENEIVPKFYYRDENGIPVDWLEIVKEAIRSAGPAFSTARMVTDYTEQLYLPAMVGGQ